METPRNELWVHACGLTDRGRVRPQNEDAFVICDLTAASQPEPPPSAIPVRERGVLLAVSDGMGGAEAGEIASSLVVESLKDHLGEECRWSEIQGSMKCAVEQTNLDVWQAAQESGRRGMGATLTAVLVHRAIAYVASVGDSRAYIMRNNRLRQVTKDQSYVETLVGAGVITREEAARSPYRSVILQAMGQRPDVHAALGRIELRRGDTFLLCTDGLSNMVGDEEKLRVLLEYPDHGEACRRLVELANAQGGEDNITVLIGEIAGEVLDEPASDETVTGSYEPIEEYDPTKDA